MSARTFTSLLLLLFIALKLCGVIKWSWWWVMAPMWIPAILAGCVGLFLVVYIKFFETKEQKSAREIGDAIRAYGKALGHK